MYIRAFRINVACGREEFGFSTSFSRGLNIIRGSNSSGKSTVVNSLLYSLGMEELVGGRNDAALQYAVRDYVECEGVKHFITESSVAIEIENQQGRVITVTRAIKSESFSPRLAKVVEGAVLTEGGEGRVDYKFIHDVYSAVYEEGFFTYLERFLGLNLPDVYDSSGKKVKLYLQAIFAALAVEQKRGWTDYVANIPFYSVKDARVKVVEYLLGTNVFELQAKKTELDLESDILNTEWASLFKKASMAARDLGLSIDGVPSKIVSGFNEQGVSVNRVVDGKSYSLPAFVASLRKKHEQLEQKNSESVGGNDKKIIEEIEIKTNEINKLAFNYENALSNLAIHQATLTNHAQLTKQAEEELTRNQVALKLKKYGAELGLETAVDVCPTCHQHIEDSLSGINQVGIHMDIDTNVRYLESQTKMLIRQEAGVRIKIQEAELSVKDFGSRLERARSILMALRADTSKGSIISRAVLKQQLFIDIEIEKIEKFIDMFDGFVVDFLKLSERLKENQEKRSFFTKEHYSQSDMAKIALFGKMFRANVGEFDYHSAPVTDIEFNYHTLLPYLAKIELREIVDTPALKEEKAQPSKGGSMAQNSSASDFVRLIWSYILALYQTSSHQTVQGNHPGLIILDEPGQHSMATKSQLALFKRLSSYPGLQAIVAASFDDSEAAFKESTGGVDFKYIRLGDKCIRPIT